MARTSDGPENASLEELPLPDVQGELSAATFRDLARMLGPISVRIRIEATAAGIRFIGVDSADADAGELFLDRGALGDYIVKRAGACELEVVRLQDFARVPRRKQLVRFEFDVARSEFRFCVGHLTRAMGVRRAMDPGSSVFEPQAGAGCALCHGTGILDTHRHSYPCPWCAGPSPVAA